MKTSDKVTKDTMNTGTGGTTDVSIQDPTLSKRFTDAVIREFSAISTQKMNVTAPQRQLVQHLFVKIDASLQELEKKRLSSPEGDKKSPIIWANVNMQKLALDAMYRVELGLDALIPNHLSVIPYLNGRTKKYDVDLRIGYVGKDFYRRQVAIEPPKDIRYELVHANDKLSVFMKTKSNKSESYEFEIPKPFDRGDVIGGFAYIVYDDETKNKIVLLSKKDFEKAKSCAKSNDFWTKWEEQMQYKTLVIRATDRIPVDPRKVNAAFLAVENDDATDAAVVQSQIENRSNKGEVIYVTAESETTAQESTTDTATGEVKEETVGGESPCICNDMQKDKITAYDCPKHGRFQLNKAGKYERMVTDADEKPNGKRPGW
jgi:recombination protein RecT